MVARKFTPPTSPYTMIGDVYLDSNTHIGRYLPFVYAPSFFKEIIQAIHLKKDTVTVKRWNTAPPVMSLHFMQIYHSVYPELWYNKRLDRKDTLYPLFVPNKVLEKLLTLPPPKKIPLEVETFIQNTLKHRKTREVETITIPIMEALNLLNLTHKTVFGLDVYVFNITAPRSTIENDAWHRKVYYRRYSTSINYRRSIKLQHRPRFSIDNTTIFAFIKHLYFKKYNDYLEDVLNERGHVFSLVPNLLGPPHTILYHPVTESRRYAGKNYPGEWFNNKFMFCCNVCEGVYSGHRTILDNKHATFIMRQHKSQIQLRVVERQKNPAKYSNNDIYRQPITKEEHSIELPFNGIDPKKSRIVPLVTGYLTRLRQKVNSPNVDTVNPPIGGIGHTQYIDQMQIDHWKWDREEVPYPDDFKPIDNYPGLSVCPNCTTHIAQKYTGQTKTTRIRNIVNNTLDEQAQLYDLYVDDVQRLRDTPTRMTFEITPVQHRTIPLPPRQNFKRLPYNSNVDTVIIKDHKANPLLTYGGFYTAKNEPKFIQREPYYDRSKTLAGFDLVDKTLYLGVEIEVTPASLCSDVLMRVVEHPEINAINAKWFYIETKYLAGLVASEFINTQRLGIVKHDGSTANGFEIVTVPGTHKWHIEEGWKGFFTEDYPKGEELLAPATWLCGWANNGGKSKNPIYMYTSERDLGHGHRPICGIHIHASRNAISPLTLGKMQAFITNPQNLKFVEQIAGRTSAKYAKIYTKPVKSGYVLNQIKKGTGNSHDYLEPATKYEALNVNTGKPTIEFRIFRSNVSKNGFMKNIDFVHAFITWCSNTSYAPSELLVPKFVEWCNTQRGVYKYLTRWLIAHKYLDNIHEFNPNYHNPITFEDETEDHKTTTMRVA